MADPKGTPTQATIEVTMLDVGAIPTIPATPVTPPTHGTMAQPAAAPVFPSAAQQTLGASATDPVNGIGIEGEEAVWEAGYSIRNFIGRLALRAALGIVWIVMAIDVWAYNDYRFQLPVVLGGIVLLVLWVGVISRIIATKLGHKYRLTTRRLFISTGVLHRERDQMELLRVRDVFERQQSLFDRWFGVGTVTVVSSDKSLPTFHILGVEDPKRVMDLIWHHARAEQDQRSVKVEQV